MKTNKRQFKYKVENWFRKYGELLGGIYVFIIMISLVIGVVVVMAVDNANSWREDSDKLITFEEYASHIPVFVYVIIILVVTEMAYLSLVFGTQKCKYSPSELFVSKICAIFLGAFSIVFVFTGFMLYHLKRVLVLWLIEVFNGLINLIKKLIGLITPANLLYIGIGVGFITLNIIIMNKLYGRR